MPRLRFHLILASVLFAIGHATAATPVPSPSATTSAGARLKARVLRMSEFFDTMLPGVLQERNITLHFTPKFSDLRDEEYMRFPFELRYGIAEGWELSAGLTPFVPSPFNTGRDHRWGPGEAKFGARYDLGNALPFFDDTTVGVETRIPLGKPPIEINDHYTHVKPFVSAARTLRAWPDVTFYANLSYDRTVELTDRAPPPPQVIRYDVIEVVPGLLFKPDELGYFGEYRWRHIRQTWEWHIEHEVRVGTIWDVPTDRSEKWNLPGKWQLELAYKVKHEEGAGTHHGVSARVKWRTSLREVLNHTAKAK
jgi:hypothetical protein